MVLRFFQYQFVAERFAIDCLDEILKKYLIVNLYVSTATLKMLGQKNSNYLSFAKDGLRLLLILNLIKNFYFLRSTR